MGWLLAALTRHPRLVIGLPAVAVVLAAIISLVVAPIWTSRAAFAPETRSPLPNLSPSLLGLASQFGISLGGQSSQGPWFYVELIRSRELGTRLLLTRFPVPGTEGDSARLLDILRIRGSTEGRRIENGLKRLRRTIAADVDARTFIVNLAVDARDRHLAHDVTSRLLQELNAFNLERRRTQARARRIFLEERVQGADSSLRAAEEALQTFYQRNRRWQDDPALQFQDQRLRRQVNMGEDLATTLRREYETARIEEVNDTPVFTVVDAPSLPDYRSSPRRKLWVIVTFIVAITVSATTAIFWESLRQLRSAQDPHLAEAERTLLRWVRRIPVLRRLGA